jgi:hypothetical protein
MRNKWGLPVQHFSEIRVYLTTRSGNALDSYSEGGRFESRPEHRLS